MSHEQIAAEIATAIDRDTVRALDVSACGRQGDVLLLRVGDSAARGAATPAGGTMIAAGSHGEHRVMAESYSRHGEVLDLPAGAVVVHTDVPLARHAPLRLAPGRWKILIERELGMGDSVVQVRD